MIVPSEFRAETVIEASAERVYAFHEDPHNVGHISPPWQRVRSVTAQHVAAVGDHFSLTVALFGMLPLSWEGRWTEVRRPELLADEIVRGPFAFWSHRHSFASLAPDRTLLTDHVRYRFPGGWLGWLFGETLGKLQFRLMFADRHARTRKHFSKQV